MKVADTTNDAVINGKSLADFGAFLTSWNVPPFPNTRDNELDTPGVLGIYDAGTEIARLDVTMQVGFWTASGGRKAIRQAIREFIAWIDPRQGYVPVTFQEDPDFFLMLKPTSTTGSGIITMNPEGGTGEAAATVDVQWKAADPHWYSNVTGEQTVGPITSAATGHLDNVGGAPTPMGITVQATAAVAGGFIITVGGETIQYNGALVNGDVIFIDTDAWVMTKNGGNAIGAWSGSFPMLQPGNQDLTVNKAGLNVTVNFTPRWLA